MDCSICGKPRGFIAGLFGGPDHPACAVARDKKIREEAAAREKLEQEESELRKKREQEELAARRKLMLERIERGIFKALNGQSEMMLDEGETLCVLVKGCWSTLFYPRAAGHALPGQSVRVDGLKKVDFGSLHITDKRICFVGKGGAKVIPLKKLLQCEAKADTLHVTAQGRASSTYFIIESSSALELVHACILKLTELAKAGKRPIVD